MNLQIGKSYKMRNGKKMTVTRIGENGVNGKIEGEDYGEAWYPEGNYFFTQQSPYDIIAEWKEPKKTLSDMKENTSMGVCEKSNYYYEEDVKEAIQSFLASKRTDEDAKAIFGEEMVQK